MSDAVQITASFSPTPEQLAESFWAMNSDEQVAFFGHLHKIAGTSLCFQMAGVVQAIQQLEGSDDWHALNGFQTMLAHAQNYGEGATDYRVWGAKRELDDMARVAKRQFA